MAGRRPTPEPVAGQRPVATGIAALIPDSDGRRGWTVYVNGVESSHVDLDDPTRLDFEYMRWIADALDVLAVEGEPLRVVHLGGAGCTLAQYVGATRPLSRQLVVEIDAGVLELAKQAFGLRSSARMRLRVGDARAELAAEPDDSADIVIRDAFAGAATPGHLLTRSFVTEVTRVLRPDGVYLANLADDPRLGMARREAATALAVFEHVGLVAEPGQLNGRRYGNVVVAGSAMPLPLQDWGRRLSSDAVRARLLDTEQVRAFASGRRPIEDPAEAGAGDGAAYVHDAMLAPGQGMITVTPDDDA
jgi:spermidine synthase